MSNRDDYRRRRDDYHDDSRRDRTPERRREKDKYNSRRTNSYDRGERRDYDSRRDRSSPRRSRSRQRSSPDERRITNGVAGLTTSSYGKRNRRSYDRKSCDSDRSRDGSRRREDERRRDEKYSRRDRSRDERRDRRSYDKSYYTSSRYGGDSYYSGELRGTNDGLAASSAHGLPGSYSSSNRKRAHQDYNYNMPHSNGSYKERDYESIYSSRNEKYSSRRSKDNHYTSNNRSNSSDYRIRRGKETGNRQRRADRKSRRSHSDDYYNSQSPSSRATSATYQASTSTYQKHKSRRDDESVYSSRREKPEYSDKRTRELYDDDENHLKVTLGSTTIRSRHDGHEYRCEKMLGEGTFGKVYRITNVRTKEKGAMKVIKSEDRYVDSAQLEINVLRKIREQDPHEEYSCIRLSDDFSYHGHPCLIFPILGKSTYDFQKDNDYRPFKFDQVKKMTFQLIRAVKFLHDMKLTHTDLKPENILFVDDRFDEFKSRSGKTIRVIRNCDIKLIDFGSATFEHERKTRIVATRHYRPPEVILELSWSHPCDVWSTGCIMFEWYMGICMFQTHDNREHLAMMERILGPFPDRMVRESKKGKKYFYKKSRSSVSAAPSAGDNDLYRVDWDWESSDGRYVRENCKPLDRYNQLRTDHEHNNLFHLMKVMLDYDPKRRITLAEALRHRFVEPQYEQFLEERRERQKIQDTINDIIFPKEKKSSSRRDSSRERRRSDHDSKSGQPSYVQELKSRPVNGHTRNYLDRLLEQDAKTSSRDHDRDHSDRRHSGSSRNAIYENVGRVKMTNGRGAATANGQWVKDKDGKWIQEAPKTLISHSALDKAHNVPTETYC